MEILNIFCYDLYCMDGLNANHNIMKEKHGIKNCIKRLIHTILWYKQPYRIGHSVMPTDISGEVDKVFSPIGFLITVRI